MAPRFGACGGALIAAVIAGFAAPAWCAPPRAASPALVQALARCRADADDKARLACYDSAAAALVDAEKSGDVVVVDQALIKEAKRQSFGFNINLGPLFDHGGKTELKDLVTAVASAVQTPDGKWVVHTAEGQVWREIDSDPLYRDPRKGDKVVISRGSLGSFFLKIGDDTAFRAHRDE